LRVRFAPRPRSLGSSVRREGGGPQRTRGRFEGIPDVHYGDADHFACGRRGVSEWTLTGTDLDGNLTEVRGCDLWTIGDDGLIARKDSFWKLRES